MEVWLDLARLLLFLATGRRPPSRYKLQEQEARDRDTEAIFGCGWKFFGSVCVFQVWEHNVCGRYIDS